MEPKRSFTNFYDFLCFVLQTISAYPAFESLFKVPTILLKKLGSIFREQIEAFANIFHLPPVINKVGPILALNGIVVKISGLTALTSCGGDIIRNVVDAVGGVGNTLNNVAATVIAIVDGILNGLYVNDIIGALDGLLKNLLCALQGLLTQVVAGVTELLNKVNAAVNEALCELPLALRSVVEIVSETLTGLFATLQKIELGCAFNGLLSQVSVVVAGLLCQVAALADEIVADVREVLAHLQSSLSGILTTLQDSLGNLELECPSSSC